MKTKQLLLRSNINYTKELIIGNLDDSLKTKSILKRTQNQFALVSEVEPKFIKDVLTDEN